MARTHELSGGGERSVCSTLGLLDRLYTRDATPPSIANILLEQIKKLTGVYDPYATVKHREYRSAISSMSKFRGKRPISLSDHIALSALGNSTDFFTGDSFSPASFILKGNMEKIEDVLLSGEDEILMLGDNMGDLVFDAPLVHFLEGRGKKVFYAVKGGPVQNDASMEDISRYNLENAYSCFIHTGKARVGIAREDMTGLIEELWENDGPVIAKGMGNFETISEFDDERQVVYIMKVKCPAVAKAVESEIGTYTAYVR